MVALDINTQQCDVGKYHQDDTILTVWLCFSFRYRTKQLSKDLASKSFLHEQSTLGRGQATGTPEVWSGQHWHLAST